MKRYDLELKILLAFAFMNGLADSALIPLLPTLRHSFGLSAVETSLLLTTTTFAMLVGAMPIGYAANRFGTRGPLLIAAALTPIAMVGQAVAVDLGMLLASRFLFGLSFGILWVIGPARAAASGRGAGGTGPLLAASGAGWLIGPVVTGFLADGVGWRLATVALAVVTVPLIPLVARHSSRHVRGERLPGLRLRAAAGLVRHNRAIAGAALVSAMLGIVGGVSGLLVPLALSANGLSAGQIGLAFGMASAAWIATATAVGRLRSSSVHFRGMGLAIAILACTWMLPAFGLSTLVVIAFLILSTGCRAIVNALNYAVGARASDGDTAPLVIGIMNLAWAAMAIVAPLLAALAEGSSEVRIAFAVTGVAAASVAAVLLMPRPRPRPGSALT